MGVPEYIPSYSVDDYAAWEGDWELWNGLPVAMSPAPSMEHSRLCGEVVFLLKEALRDAGCPNCIVYPEADWKVNPNTLVRPDVSIGCGIVEGQSMEEAPVLIVEVLSPRTRSLDLNERRALYASEGVRYYFVVDPEDKSIKEWDGKVWVAVEGPLDLELDDDCRVEWRLDGMFR